MTAPSRSDVHIVGAGAGFAGDRLEPARAMAASGGIDEIVFECLAERTLVSALRAREADSAAGGWDPRLARRLGPLLGQAVGGCRLISNMGAANPAGAVDATARLAREGGIRGLCLAAVQGDDLADRIDLVTWERPPQGRWLGAHAYLGMAGIQEALEAGAHVVLTGRVADSALFAAGAARAMAAEGDAVTLAGMLAIGHLLECSGQLTGGNLADPSGTALDAAALAGLAFPLATIHSDGSAELSLQPGHPGRLDRTTCTLQLLYEVHDPACYPTPDLCLDLSHVEFEELEGQCVRMSGALPVGVPERFKVVGFLEQPGQIVDAEVAYAGSGAYYRARVAAEVLERRLEAAGIRQRQIDLVGVDSVLGVASGPLATPPIELRVHVSAACGDQEEALMLEDEVYGLTLNGPAGGCAIRVECRPRIDTVTGFIAREHVSPRVDLEVVS